MTKFDAIPAKAGRILSRFRHDESGTTAIEYAIIASGIAVVIVSTVYSIGSSVKNMFTTVLGLFPS